VVVEVHPGAVTVPEAAVQISNRQRYVFVLQAGDRVQRRAIETGVDHGDWVEVLRGLSGGDEVVLAGADGLDDGGLVRPLRQVDPYSGEGLAKIPTATSTTRTP
jgi:multidrug efflux system membrane fusion protein